MDSPIAKLKLGFPFGQVLLPISQVLLHRLFPSLNMGLSQMGSQIKNRIQKIGILLAANSCAYCPVPLGPILTKTSHWKRVPFSSKSQNIPASHKQCFPSEKKKIIGNDILKHLLPIGLSPELIKK